MKSLFDENLNKTKEKRSKSEADNRALKADYSREQLKKQILEAFLLDNFEDQKEKKIAPGKNTDLNIIYSENQIGEVLENEIFNYANENSKDKKYREKSLKILNRLRGKSNCIIRNYLRNKMISIAKFVYEDKIELTSNNNIQKKNSFYNNNNESVFDSKVKFLPANQHKFNLNKIPKIPPSNLISNIKRNENLNKNSNDKKLFDKSQMNEIAHEDLISYDPYGAKDFDYESYYKDQIQTDSITAEDKKANDGNKNHFINKKNEVEFETFVKTNNENNNFVSDENEVYLINNKIKNLDSSGNNPNNVFKTESRKTFDLNIERETKNNKVDLGNQSTDALNNYTNKEINNQAFGLLNNHDYYDNFDKSLLSSKEGTKTELISEDKDNYYINNISNSKSLDKSFNFFKNENIIKNCNLSVASNKIDKSTKGNILRSKSKDKNIKKNFIENNQSINTSKSNNLLLEDNKYSSNLNITSEVSQLEASCKIKNEDKDTTSVVNECNSKNDNNRKNLMQQLTNYCIQKFKRDNINPDLRKQNIEMEIELIIARNKIITLENEIKKLKQEKQIIQTNAIKENEIIELEKFNCNKALLENKNLKKEIYDLKSQAEKYRKLKLDLKQEMDENSSILNKKNNLHIESLEEIKNKNIDTEESVLNSIEIKCNNNNNSNKNIKTEIQNYDAKENNNTNKPSINGEERKIIMTKRKNINININLSNSSGEKIITENILNYNTVYNDNSNNNINNNANYMVNEKKNSNNGNNLFESIENSTTNFFSFNNKLNDYSNQKPLNCKRDNLIKNSNPELITESEKKLIISKEPNSTRNSNKIVLNNFSNKNMFNNLKPMNKDEMISNINNNNLLLSSTIDPNSKKLNENKSIIKNNFLGLNRNSMTNGNPMIMNNNLLNFGNSNSNRFDNGNTINNNYNNFNTVNNNNYVKSAAISNKPKKLNINNGDLFKQYDFVDKFDDNKDKDAKSKYV